MRYLLAVFFSLFVAPAMADYSGPLFNVSGLLTISPNYAGAGNISTALVLNPPSQISSYPINFGFGTTFAEIGQLEIINNAAGDNTLAVVNNNIGGYAAVTFRGPDKYYTNTATVFEHGAIGWNAPQGYDFIESSTFDANSNPLIPPSAFWLQQSGGVDASGGISTTCSITINSPTLTCIANGGPNGNLITASSDGFPATTGIPAATTVSSGGGTTTLTMSANATLTNGSLGVTFTNPVFNQYSYFKATRTGPVFWLGWNGTVDLTIDRVHNTVGVGTLANQGNPSATLEVGGTATIDSSLTTNNVTVLACNDYNVPTTGQTYTLPANKCGAILEPAGTLATLTIKLPASPVNGQVAWFSTTQAITALTVSPNSGQVIRGGTTPGSLVSGGSFAMVYNTNTVWYPLTH